MLRKSGLMIICAALFLLASPVFAQEPQPEHEDPFWQVSYWNNTDLSGEPVVRGTDQSIAFSWGNRSPRGGVNADRFSARWTRYIDVEAGTYRFTATGDDGIRVLVDGSLVVDGWYDHPVKTFTGDISLTAGHHLVTVEYYEKAGMAVASVTWWGPIPSTIRGWRGEYFDEKRLTGRPVLVRDDPEVDFDWGAGSPAPGIPRDSFAVRWTRRIRLPAGDYRFTATSDDGIRVYVDDRLVINGWYDHSVRTFTAHTTLPAGDQVVVVEYYENSGNAVAKVSWEPVPSTALGWRGEYFDNRWLRGSPALVRNDERIAFTWGYGPPADSMPSDGFSARWTRMVTFEPGVYRFTVRSDDGVRLWVNGHVLIDEWHDQAYQPHSGTLYVAGDVRIRLEYYESSGIAALWLGWSHADDDPPDPAPGTVVVDDADVSFVKGGSATAWHKAPEGYRGQTTWTRNNERRRYNYNWARWFADLRPGRYEVFVYIPERYSTTSHARYWVAHRDGFTPRSVDQSANGDRWVSLGTYWFQGNRKDYVSLSDVTYERYVSRLVAFDAVKWEPR